MILVVAAALASAPISNEVTVYNQGFGLIKENRVLNLKEGRQTVSVEDVASMIEPSSVSVQSLTDKGSFRVLEQNYRYDLISPLAILNKSVGQKVRFVRFFGSQRETLEGTLISAPTAIVGTPDGANINTYNGMVIRTADGRIVLNPTGEIEVSSVPSGLISKPTLMWDLEADKAGENKVELSYLTRGITWSSDYVFTLDAGNRAALQGWVTVDNQSGATFENAKLKLLAGDVQRAAPEMARTMRGMGGGGFGGGMAKDSFQEESLFEYHLYTLQRPATVRNRETKQLALLDAPSVPYTKRLILDSTRQFGQYQPGEGEVGTGNLKPQVRVEFENKKEYGLGVPLPKGRLKVYQRDASGSVQLLGEDNIDHTPRDEKLSIVVGRSFDVVADRRRTNFQRINSNTVRETFEIEVRNRKTTPERVFVIERNWWDWKVLEKSQDFDKLEAHTIQFTVDLKANEAKTIKYTIQTTWP